jgi:hypothetical protein
VVDPDPDPDADPDAEGDEELPLDDGLLVHALTTPSVSTATAAVPYRHRLPVLLLVGLTCSYLLTSKSCDDPGYGQPPRERREVACRSSANRSRDGPPTWGVCPF